MTTETAATQGHVGRFTWLGCLAYGFVLEDIQASQPSAVSKDGAGMQ